MPGGPIRPGEVRRCSRDFAVRGSSCERVLSSPRLFADGWPAFLVPHPLVKNLPNETTEPVGDGTNGLCAPEGGDESAIRDGENRTLDLHGGVGGLIEDAGAGLPNRFFERGSLDCRAPGPFLGPFCIFRVEVIHRMH
jgi:hypothetical protein